MSNLIDDLVTITTIPKTALLDLLNKTKMCISYEAASLSKEDSVEIDIGIGTLYIGNMEGNIKYKFVPSKSLDTEIRDAIKGNVKLIRTCEDSLVNRILNVYKDLI